MARYVARIPVSVTRSAAFAYLSRFDRAAEWDRASPRARCSPPNPSGSGPRFRLAARFLGRSIPLEYEIVESTPDGSCSAPRAARSVRPTRSPSADRGTDRGLRRGARRQGPRPARRSVPRPRVPAHRRSRRGGAAPHLTAVPSMTRRRGRARLADAALEATVVGSFSRLGFAARRALFDWDAEPAVDLSGRVALVTGATGGSRPRRGAALARATRTSGSSAATRGARSTPRDEIVAVDPGAPSVSTVIADLAVLDDVRTLADRVLQTSAARCARPQRGGAHPRPAVHGDGLEVTAQVHVVAPFLLTTALLPLLRSTPAPASSRCRRAACTRSASISTLSTRRRAVRRRSRLRERQAGAGGAERSWARPARARRRHLPRDAPGLGRHARGPRVAAALSRAHAPVAAHPARRRRHDRVARERPSARHERAVLARSPARSDARCRGRARDADAERAGTGAPSARASAAPAAVR